MCRGLTFSQPAPRRPASYGASSDFDHHALVAPAPPRPPATSAATVGVGGDHPRHPQRLGHRGRQHRGPLGGRPVEHVLAVGVQDVEEVRRQRGRRPRGRHVDPGRDPAAGLLERPRPAVRPQRDRLAVEHQLAHRQRQRRLDHLGHPVGDVVQAAGEDRDVGARPVHLHPDAVELPLDRRRAPAGRARRRRRSPSRRASAAPGGRPAAGTRPAPAAPPVSAAAATGPTAPRSIAARRTSASGTSGGLRDRRQHHALQRALAQLAGEQAAQQRAAPARWPGANRSLTGRTRSRLRPGAGQPGDPLERGVDLAHAERRLRRPAPAGRAARPSRRRSGAAAARRTGRPRRPAPRPGRRPAEHAATAATFSVRRLVRGDRPARRRRGRRAAPGHPARTRRQRAGQPRSVRASSTPRWNVG